MLAGELKAYAAKEKAGEVPAQPLALPPENSFAPPSLSGLHVSAPKVSASLPSGGHASLLGSSLPPKPRFRPSMPTISQLPALELPEASPLSSSLLERANINETSRPSSSTTTEETGLDEDMVGGTSMLEIPSRQPNYVYAASAPATMLWGPVGHKPGMAGMGGRTPSKTLLEALAAPPGQLGPTRFDLS